MPIRLDRWSVRRRLAILVAALGVHVVLFFLPLSPNAVYDAGFGAVVVLVAAILFGFRVGIITALATVPLHVALLVFVLDIRDFPSMAHIFFPEGFAASLVGASAGMARDFAIARSTEGERWRRLVAATSDAIIVCDVESERFVDCNGAALKLFGCSREQFLAKTIMEISAEPDATAAQVPKTIAAGQAHIPLRYCKRHDGAIFPSEIDATLLTFGPKTLLMAIIRDISARLASERTAADLSRARAETATATAVAAAQEAERRKLAREMHDSIGSNLATLLVGARAVADHAVTDEATRKQLVTLRERARAIMDEASRIARGLHPSILEDIGLVPAIEQLGNDFRATHGIEVDFVVRGAVAGTFKGETDLAIFRIAQEALANVAAHAAATHVTVLFERVDGAVRLTVEDNGRGFDAVGPIGQGHGTGLRGMRDRASHIGGRLEVDSESGRGTSLRATIPL